MKVFPSLAIKANQVVNGCKVFLFSTLLLIVPEPAKALTIVNTWQPIF